jgi:2-octaprenyl-6-methoxyphenol hydroxylase
LSAANTTDVIIIGGGIIGLTQALALCAHGISSHVVDRADPAVMLADNFDGRTSAVSSSSMKMFEAIGMGNALTGKGCPIAQIWVSDGLKPGALDFVPGQGEGYLGQMFENRLLRRTLFDAASGNPRITLHMPQSITETVRSETGVTATLDNGALLSAKLLIVAEGRNSQTRQQAGLKIAHWQYDHSALVGAIFHEKPHRQIAYEIFYPTGPFAILPMLDNDDGRHRSAIVWSQTRGDTPAYLKLSPRAFAAELEAKMGGMLGNVEMAAPLSAYPLGFHHCTTITAQRLVLVGDSAHGIHPIAGQGLNLGLRDVATLTEVLTTGMRLGMDFGDTQLLERYGRWRSVDTLMVSVATDSLNRLFSVPGNAASAVRRFGLGLVQKTAPVKGFFMAEARGESGELPKLLTGQPV